MSVNYTNSFITVAPDCKAQSGIAPTKPGTVAALQYELLANAPYSHTSEDILFSGHAARNLPIDADLLQERAAFFAKPQACLRASPLVKTYGWGLHHDDQGRVALVGVESPNYAAFVARADVKVLSGMRNKRG